MKRLSVFAIGFLMSLSAMALQTVTKDLGTNGAWKTSQVSGHDLWNTDACIAATPAKEDASTLEVYAAKATGTSAYTEPSVQVVTRGAVGFVRAVLTNNDSSVKTQLTLASTQSTPPSFGVLARLDDRAGLIAVLKQANSVAVQLINEKNVVVKTLNFSLHGSSKAIDAANVGCALGI